MKRLYVRWKGYRSILGPGIQAYLGSKRALGRNFGNEERALRLLDRYLAESGIVAIPDVTPTVIEAFLVSRPRSTARSYNLLLGDVRRLLDWLSTQGVPGIVPYAGRPRRETGRRAPVIFGDSELAKLLDAAGQLPDDGSARLRGPAYQTLFATLCSLGLRVGEVSRLEVGDVDLERELLGVRRTKFGKDRLVPFGPRLAATLRRYLDLRRNAGLPMSPSSPLFTVKGGRAISTNSIRRVFHHLVDAAGVRKAAGPIPRVHDLRHTFAVTTLLRWYREQANPGVRLHRLSTFLGHVNIRATAVYLTITSDLLDEASGRFEALASSVLRGAA